MAIQILPVAATAASSTDQVLSGNALVSLKGAVSGASVDIESKDDAGGYNKIGALAYPGAASAVLPGAGTYRFTRYAGAACGVYIG